MTAKSAIITALNTSTFVPVVMPGGSGKWNVTYYTDDLTAWLYATDVAGSDEAPMLEDATYEHTLKSKADGVLFYAKATAGTPDLVLFTAQ